MEGRWGGRVWGNAIAETCRIPTLLPRRQGLCRKNGRGEDEEREGAYCTRAEQTLKPSLIFTVQTSIFSRTAQSLIPRLALCRRCCGRAGEEDSFLPVPLSCSGSVGSIDKRRAQHMQTARLKRTEAHANAAASEGERVMAAENICRFPP